MLIFMKNMRIRTAIITVAAIPVIIAFIYSAQLVYSDFKLVRDLDSLGDLTTLSIKISDLVHEQQLERGASAMYLGSKGAKFYQELVEQREVTDRKRKVFLDYIGDFDLSAYGSGFSDSINTVFDELEELENIRKQMDSLSISLPETIAYYTNLNLKNMDVISEFALLSSNAVITNYIHAYVNFMLSKEYAGVERAVASGALGKGSFSPETLDELLRLVTIQDTYIEVFLDVATKQQRAFYKEAIRSEVVDEVYRMRKEIIGSRVLLPNDEFQEVGVLAVNWFDNITAKINLLKQVENKLAEDLEQKMAVVKVRTKNSRDRNFLVALSSTVLALFICFQIIRTFNQSFREIVASMSGLANGDINTPIPPETRNEMGEMVRALQVFKANKIKSDNLAATIEWQRQTEAALNELSEVLRGQQEMKGLANVVVQQLAHHLDVQLVALFVLRNNNTYEREAVYGYPKQGGIDKFESGDGLLGQVVVDAKPLKVTNVPEYAQLALGMGIVLPSNLLIYPLVHNEKVVAILELGGFGLLDEAKQAWLDKASAGLAVTIRLVLDLEQRNRVAKELAESKELAEAANKAKSGFLANMSHELRTPMNAILGYSEMLMEEAEDVGQDDFIPDLKKIHQAGSHLLALINEVLDLSKIESGKMEVYAETFDVGGLIDQVSGTAQPLMAKNTNHYKIERGENIGSACQDVTKLRQSLLNLLSNAAKFTHEGTVTLSVERENVAGVDWLIFSVSDTGIGIPPEKVDYVFEEFSQADNSTTRDYGGTGLGLAISRRFCQLMGGDLVATSQVGVGSTFSIRLPAEAPGAKASQPAVSVAQVLGDSPDRKSGKTVLVIDDDVESCEIIRRLMEKDGFNVVTALSGVEGLRLAHQLQPTAITLDVIMPEMDGWSVLRALKADPVLQNIPVIMLSMIDDKGKGFSLGATDYLTKPVGREQLHKTLAQYYTPSESCSVLLVEDDQIIREMMVQALGKIDWQVNEAGNGREALEQLTLHKPQLILLDLMMPVMDGFDFLLEMRTHTEWRDIPVIVLTAKDLTEEDRRILSGRVEQIVEKSASSHDQVVDLIHQVMDRSAS